MTGGTNVLQVRRQPEATAFLARAEPWLLEHEAEHNIILAIAYLLTQPTGWFKDPYLSTVETPRGVEGCAIHPPPDGLYLTQMPPSALRTVAEQLASTSRYIAEVFAPDDLATEFASLWRPGAWTLHGHFQRYRLDRIAPHRPAQGALRRGERGDLALLREWAAAYARALNTKTDVTTFFERILDRGRLFLWDDGGPRCVVTASGLTPNGARISAVYTPAQYRGNGYATSAVAAVCRKVLEGGRKFCIIAADKNQPAPNAIYRRIGFEPIGTFVHVHF